MKNKQEVWIAMIISGYSKKLDISMSEASRQLLSCSGIDYLEEYYSTLHQLSNNDVICELMEMAGVEVK